MAEIEKTTMYTYKGKVFPSVEKAVEHAETLGYDYFKPLLIDKGFTVTEVYKIWEVLTSNRHELVEFLSFELPLPEQDE